VIRVVGVALLGAILGGFLTHGSEVGVLVGFFGVLGLMVFGVASGRQRLRCPFCRKRVKLGASTCHHCGRVVSTGSH